ncbi:MAG: sulfotransferase, partial [Microcystaceae cyanobacterium]
NTLLKKKNPLRSSANFIVSSFLPIRVRRKLRSRLIELNSKPKDKAIFLPEDRQQLFKIYREDILKLQDLIQKDLASWLIV